MAKGPGFCAMCVSWRGKADTTSPNYLEDIHDIPNRDEYKCSI